MKKPENLKELLEQGIVRVANLPPKNDFLFSGGKVDYSRLQKLDGYTVPLTDHDYAARTPIMWNSLYENLGMNIRNIMVVANPADLETITAAFKSDPKYLGGGFGSGFKDKGVSHMGRVEPNDLEAINIVVKEEGQLVGYNTDALGFVMSLDDKFKQIGKGMENRNYIILGAGGVAPEIVRLIAKRKPNRIVILNRTVSKAVSLANSINEKLSIGIAVAGGEDIIRGYCLNSFTPPDAIINLTNKGSDGPFENFAAFASTEDRGQNETFSRTVAKELYHLNPQVIVADIAFHKSGRTRTMRIAENAGLVNLIDGTPMVVNQAAPAYVYVQKAHPEIHPSKVSEEEALAIFRTAVEQA